MRAEGEWLHRLASLELPPDAVDLSAADALRYSAVQLFNERAMAAVDGFTFDDADVPAVLEICRRLDGMPLALELAAARIDVFGVRGLGGAPRRSLSGSDKRPAHRPAPASDAQRDARLELSAALGSRTYPVLRRLSVFAGDFPLEAAIAVTAEILVLRDRRPCSRTSSAKSLVAADLRGDFARYRLLDTTRLYASRS